jgi:DNA-binding LacI/PurR family transcriptional regulator
MAAVTIKQIAEKVGLSEPTVSRILNNSNYPYRKETRELVRTAARDLGYRLNTSAKAFRTGKFGCAALLMSTQRHLSFLPIDLLAGINGALSDRNMHLTLASLSDEQLDNAEFVPKILHELTADGLIINYIAAIPPRLLSLIEQPNVPCVWVNSKQPVDCVYPNDQQAGYMATRHLLGLGHKRIAYVPHLVIDNSPHYSQSDRYAGYEQAMRELGLEPRIFHPGRRISISEMAAYAEEQLASHERPTALIGYSPEVLQPIIFRASTLGIIIPEQLSFVTFNEIPPADGSTGLWLTSWIIPEYDCGQTAVAMLCEKIKSPGISLPSQAKSFSFFEGASCAPVPPPL